MVEVLAFVLALPLLVLVLGVIFFSLADIGSFVWWLFLMAVILFVLIRGGREAVRTSGTITDGGTVEEIDKFRRIIISFSIMALLPIFVRYLIFATDESLTGIILGLAIGFAVGIWGMFLSSHKALMYSNLVGGGLVIIYAYSQIWELGDAPRIIAAAFGLVVAVAISIIKLRERLT